MNVFIRADASTFTGTGHIMRCLTLADGLNQRGAWVSFICSEIPGNLCEFIESKGYKVFRLAGQNSGNGDYIDQSADFERVRTILANEGRRIDWLVVDHYLLDCQWESQLRPYIDKIMVIDDMANRPHDCDLLLDQNLHSNMDSCYNSLVPDCCCKLIGPKYSLLRPEFMEERLRLKKRQIIKNVFVFFGGSDPTNETIKALYALQLLNQHCINVDVVIGSSNPNKREVWKYCRAMPGVRYHCQTNNMAQLMASADLAIGAGGSASWERCCLGLPSLVVILAENQRDVTESLAKTGAIINLGWADKLTPGDYANAINNLDGGILREMSRKGMGLVDGKGCCRVVEILLNHEIKK